MQLNLKKTDYSAYLFILPAIIIISMFLVYPTVWSLIASLKTISPLSLLHKSIFSAGEWTGISNYILSMQDPIFIKSLLNTLYFAVIFIPITMFASVGLAVILDKKFFGSETIKSLFFAPYVISIISASLIFMMLFNSRSGLVNGALGLMGITGPNWLSDSSLAMPVIAVMSSWRRIGYFMLLYIAGLQNISPALYEAADIDGASEFQKFKNITWPLLRRINTVVFVLLIINCLNVFQEVFVMTGGGPGNSTSTVPFLIYNEAFKYYDLGKASAMSYLLFVIVILIVITQDRINKRKLDY